MGFDTELEEIFSFTYYCKFDNGLAEMEYDHVFIGKWDGTPIINCEEVADYKWVSKDFLKKEIEKKPEIFTTWFKVAWEKLLSKIGG